MKSMKRILSVVLMAMMFTSIVAVLAPEEQTQTVPARALLTTTYWGNFTPTADTYGSPQGYVPPGAGSGTILDSQTSGNYYSYLRWNLTGIPTGATVDWANATLWMYENSGGGSTSYPYLFPCKNPDVAPGNGNDWAEGITTGPYNYASPWATFWHNQSVPGWVNISDGTLKTPDGVGTLGLSTIIASHLPGDPQRAALVVLVSGSELIWSSKEGSNPPKLHVSWSVESTPSAWAPAFTSTDVTTGTDGVLYSYHITLNESVTLTDAGNSTGWSSLAGANADWWLNGTAVEGWYNVNLDAVGAGSPPNGYRNFTLTIYEADHWAPLITSTSPLSAADGYPFSYVVTANESVTWSDATTDAGWLSWGAANHTWYGTADTGVTNAFVNVTPTADAMVNRNNANYNYGSWSSVYISTYGGYVNYLFYQRWDLSSLPSNAVITNAGLWMNEYASAGGACNLRLYNGSAVNWAENTITYNNRPSVSNLVTTYPEAAGPAYWKNYSGTAFNALIKWQFEHYGAVYLVWTGDPSVNFDKCFRTEEDTLKPRLHINYYTGDDTYYADVKATSVGGGEYVWENFSFYVVTGVSLWSPHIDSILPVGGVLNYFTWTVEGEPYFWEFTFNETCTYNVYTNASFLTCGSGLGTNNTIALDLWDTAFGGWDVVKGIYYIDLQATSDLGTLMFEMNWTFSVFAGVWAPHVENLATLLVTNGTYWSFTWTWNETVSGQSITTNASWVTIDSINNTMSGISPTNLGYYWFAIYANNSLGFTGYYNFTVSVYGPPHPHKDAATWIGERMWNFLSIAALLVCIFIFPVTIILVKHGEDGVKAGVRAVVVFLICAFLFMATMVM